MLKEDRKIGATSLKRTYVPHLNAFSDFLRKKKIENDFNNFTYEVIEDYAEHLNATQNGEYRRQVFASIKRWLPKLAKYGAGYVYDARIDNVEIKTISISARLKKRNEELEGSLKNVTDDWLLAVNKNQKHLEWIKRHNLYNIRLGDRSGAVSKSGLVVSASKLLLYDFHNPKEYQAFELDSPFFVNL